MNNSKLQFKILKLLTIIFTFTLLVLTSAEVVHAHVLKTDGSIGALMHIDPDDDPIANQPAGFLFEFKDKQNKFQPQDCDCSFYILEQDREIFSQPLFQNNADASLTSAIILFTFPQKDIYQIKITGKPKYSADFQPFTLTYDLRVDRVVKQNPSQNDKSSPNYLVFLSTGVIILTGVFLGLTKLNYD